MSKEHSFDIVSEFDQQELVNAIDIALKEIVNRYDLKNSNSRIDFDKNEMEITLSSQDEYKLQAVYDVLLTKALRRGLSIKVFDPQKPQSALGGTARQKVKLLQGVNSDQAKKLNKLIRDEYKKAKVQIQGESLRVTCSKIDELQEIISFVKQLDFPIPLQFNNYR